MLQLSFLKPDEGMYQKLKIKKIQLIICKMNVEFLNFLKKGFTKNKKRRFLEVIFSCPDAMLPENILL